MTKAKPSTDTTPHRYRHNLVPPAAVGVPAQVERASEELRLAGLAVEAALKQRREADKAAKAAPNLDAKAGIAARQRNDDLPPATVLTRKAEAQAALDRERADKAIAERAAIGLERAVREHTDEWLSPQRADAEERARDAYDAVDALAEALERLGVSGGIVANLQTKIAGKVIEAPRFFKARTPVVLPQLLAELREQIALMLPDPLPTAPTPEEEQFQQQRRGWAHLARGGVHVPGGVE